MCSGAGNPAKAMRWEDAGEKEAAGRRGTEGGGGLQEWGRSCRGGVAGGMGPAVSLFLYLIPVLKAPCLFIIHHFGKIGFDIFQLFLFSLKLLATPCFLNDAFARSQVLPKGIN